MNTRALLGSDGRTRKFHIGSVTSCRQTEPSSYWNLVHNWDSSMVTVSPGLKGTMDIAPFSPDRSTNIAIALVDGCRVPKNWKWVT
jgi:hypothetical protein